MFHATANGSVTVIIERWSGHCVKIKEPTHGILGRPRSLGDSSDDTRLGLNPVICFSTSVVLVSKSTLLFSQISRLINLLQSRLDNFVRIRPWDSPDNKDHSRDHTIW